MCKARPLLLVLSLLLLSACSSMPMITDEDVSLHEQTGDWLAFYEQLNSELKVAKPDSEVADNRIMYRDIVGRKIAEKKEQDLFDALGRGLSQHNIASLNAALEKSATLSVYSESVAQDYRDQLERAIKQKKGVIKNKESEFLLLDDSQSVKKMALLDEIIVIYGPSSEAATVKEQKEDYFNELVKKAHQAFTDKDYLLCEQMLTNVEKINKDFEGLAELRNNLKVAIIESHLWDALEAGHKDKAYSALQQLVNIPHYIEEHQDALAIAEDLAVYFEAEADSDVQQKQYVNAYSSYSRAHTIHVEFGLEEITQKDKVKFLAWVSQQFNRAMKAKQHYQAYGRLLVLMELEPSNAVIEKYHAELNSALLNEAKLKIVAGHIENEKQLPIQVSALFEQVGEAVLKAASVRIDWIDNAAITNQYTAAQIVSQPNTAFYVNLGGAFQAATISASEREVRAIKPVITGYNKVESPEYTAWSLLSAEDKISAVKPKKYIQLPVEQNIETISIQNQKDALIELNYWLTEIVDATAVVSSTLKQTKTFNAQTQQAVEVGLFKQDAILETLPDDEHIYGEMMPLLANALVVEMISQAESMQDKYLLKANQAVVAENFQVATRYYAYSYVLQNELDVVDADLLDKLKLYSLRVQ